MNFEKKVITYFERKGVPLKNNVKFYFDKDIKKAHEIDIIIPGYLIEIKNNFHFSNKSMLSPSHLNKPSTFDNAGIVIVYPCPSNIVFWGMIRNSLL